ncbi:NAD(P)-binding protein [Laetiporus sulphureus 93-53]|uniref:NAD(P)-binding protein n=1 Tax=Laetiporus sulphureus 93-53 TaxID=1314785 RepID=A0A165CUD2_9APHY|nr:NAD(P)-binding protein [Laetiporus sulphureus 93-53]KZT03449.1 NAD(P)-binding protein [Laetiporus sulphureus 93-53]
MPSYLITGAGRGLGLVLVRQLLKKPDTFVIATARKPEASQGLQSLAKEYSKDRLVLFRLDVLDFASYDALAAKVAPLLPNGLDYLINNAGVSYQDYIPFDKIDLKLYEEELRVNAIAPIHVTRTFLPLIRKGKAKKIVFFTSILGSITLATNWSDLQPVYSVSKAALNTTVRLWAVPLASEGIATVLLHPGWAGTDMGNKNDAYFAERKIPAVKITPDEAIEKTLKVIDDAPLTGDIKYYNNDGTEFPW